jgi:hypothetical protein
MEKGSQNSKTEDVLLVSSNCTNFFGNKSNQVKIRIMVLVLVGKTVPVKSQKEMQNRSTLQSSSNRSIGQKSLQ